MAKKLRNKAMDFVSEVFYDIEDVCFYGVDWTVDFEHPEMHIVVPIRNEDEMNDEIEGNLKASLICKGFSGEIEKYFKVEEKYNEETLSNDVIFEYKDVCIIPNIEAIEEALSTIKK